MGEDANTQACSF